ncbi:MAG TPA: ABC transporter substrate-binding protein [Stellaceae bacterium]|nr:ABC transporter substrate-binding protein [Stellaceae bacterium]
MPKAGKAIASLLAVAALCVPAAARADEPVTIGVVGAVSDTVLYLAEKKGFLHGEGLKGDITVFDSGAKMVAPLGAGQLDVGAGAYSAGLFNAVGRGINIKIVADKATNKAPYDYRAVVVRVPLASEIKSLADLKGRKIGVTAQGASDNSVLAVGLKSVGLGLNDVERVYMGFAAQFVALKNGGIDAAFGSEPDVTLMAREKIAVRFKPYSAFYPVDQSGVILFGTSFLDKDRAKGERFMRAYLRAVRFYDSALKDGHLAGPNADYIYDAIAELTKQQDKTVFHDMVASWCNPDGAIELASVKTDLDNFKAENEVPADMTAERVVDLSFAQKAVKELGPAAPTSN